MTPRKPAPTRRPRDTADGIPVWCAFDKLVDPATLRGDPENYNGHPPEQLRMIAASVKSQGWQKPIVVDIRTGLTVTGHGETAAAVQAGLKLVPVDFRWYATDADRQQWLIADNRFASLAEVQAGALKDLLQKLDTGDRDMEATGYTDKAIEELMTQFHVAEPADAEPQVDRAEELRKAWGVKTGDLWLIGGHRLLCGDSTKAADVARVTGGEKAVDCILTDPPYCSGGFQEAGKSAGSVGTDAEHVQIVNDRLSTRGFAALLKSAFNGVQSSYLYAFTDWRMWIHLFDVAESSGFGVRSMIVWNKGTPGMGRGWRCQHELILWGCKVTPPFDKHASGTGNVISEARTGNIEHTTQKPVAVIAELLKVAPFLVKIYDPFLGSGTTMVAAQNLNRRCFGIEISPAYCAVILERMKTAFPALTIRKEE